MSLLGAGYESSDEDAGAAPAAKAPPPGAAVVVAAPDVSLEDPGRHQLALYKPTDTTLTYNARYEDLARPAQGPANPFKATDGNALKRKNIPAGYAEDVVLSNATFTAQHRTFESLGYTRDLNGGYVGNLDKAQQYGGRDVIQMRGTKAENAALRKKRQKKGDAGVVDGDGAYKGPWARYEEAPRYDHVTVEEGEELASDEEWVEEEEVVAAGTEIAKPIATDYQEDLENKENTEFHGRQEFDYQGRTYMHVPQDLDLDLRKEPGSQQNFIPKKLVHTWKSHTKAITSLRFFPRSGHLLLSSSADGKVKLWDCFHQRELQRTYSGHTKSITDTCFDSSGAHFLSASFDRQMKLWDTEYGKCTGRFTTGKIPHVIKFHPGEDEHAFVAGMSDKKIVQFDTRSGKLAQEYDHHLGPVNTITFVDEDRRFITTSDDKSLRAWEWNIPVPNKFVAEPHMFSMVRAAPHPSGKYVAFQSGDNQIVVYAATDRFRQNRKKSYRGHNNAGYAIDVACSPDGQFLLSGDSGGYACFWDWKTCKMYHKFQATDGPLVCAQWHPQESSKVATAGLDGAIKYWD